MASVGDGRPRGERATLWLWRRAMVLRARDATRRSASRSCVVLAPHPDDESLGCAATIARKRRAGSRVVVVIATDGRHSTPSELVSPARLGELRRAEACVATAQLGVDPADLVFLDHEDGALAAREDLLAAQVARVVDRVRPDELLTVSARDRHPDHVALNDAARRVWTERPWCALAEYPTWYWYGGPVEPGSGIRGALALQTLRRLGGTVRAARPEKVSTRGVRGQKRNAIDAYRSQTVDLTGEPGWQVFPSGFVDCFLGGYEVFFPVTRSDR